MAWHTTKYDKDFEYGRGVQGEFSNTPQLHVHCTYSRNTGMACSHLTFQKCPHIFELYPRCVQLTTTYSCSFCEFLIHYPLNNNETDPITSSFDKDPCQLLKLCYGIA